MEGGKKIDKFGNTPSRILFICLLLFIPMLNFVIFTVYANFGGILLAFRQFDGTKEYFAGFANFIKFFRDWNVSDYGKTLGISFAYLPIVGLISLPISLVTSYFLYKKIPCAKFFVIILFLPNIIPAAVMAEFYRRLWDAGGGLVETGALNRFFSLFTGREINWLTNPEYANQALWLYTVWFGFGYNAILLWGAMNRVPKELVESAKLDGAGLCREFFSITVPIIWPTLSMVIVLTAMVPFTIYMQPLIICANGDYGTRTIALLAMQEIKRPDVYFAAAINILLACVSIPFVLIVKKLTDKAFAVVEV